MDRIDAICTLIKPCGVLADIGCDHGRVAYYALSHGAKRVIASDISESSLKKAKTLIGENERVKYIVSDGFDALGEKVDCAVLSGMGGVKIIEILSRIDYKPTLILGAQHNQKELRSYLSKNGYKIVEDFCFHDRGKYYDFIKAEEGKGEPLTEIQLRYGVYYQKKNESLREFIVEQLEKLRSYKQTKENETLTAQAEEVLKWQE